MSAKLYKSFKEFETNTKPIYIKSIKEQILQFISLKELCEIVIEYVIDPLLLLVWGLDQGIGFNIEPWPEMEEDNEEDQQMNTGDRDYKFHVKCWKAYCEQVPEWFRHAVDESIIPFIKEVDANGMNNNKTKSLVNIVEKMKKQNHGIFSLSDENGPGGNNVKIALFVLCGRVCKFTSVGVGFGIWNSFKDFENLCNGILQPMYIPDLYFRRLRHEDLDESIYEGPLLSRVVDNIDFTSVLPLLGN